MEHAIQTLSKNQYKLANHFETFERRVVAVANLTNNHLKKMSTLMYQVDEKFTELFESTHEGAMATTRFTALTSSMLLVLLQDVD